MNISVVRRHPVRIAIVVALLVAAAFAAFAGSGSTPGSERTVPLNRVHLSAVNPTSIFLHVVSDGSTWKGESTDKTHPQDSMVNTVSSGLQKSPRNPVVAREIVVQKPVDLFTTRFANRASTGRQLGQVTIFMDRLSGQTIVDYAKYVLTNAVVTSDKLDFSATGADSEVVAFRATTISVSYRPQLNTGQPGPWATYCWNFATNRAC